VAKMGRPTPRSEWILSAEPRFAHPKGVSNCPNGMSYSE
jgi:hypothetical protein